MFTPFRVGHPPKPTEDPAQTTMADHFSQYEYEDSGDEDITSDLPPTKRHKLVGGSPTTTPPTVLDVTQRAIVEAVVTDRKNILLTGPAGVGKSLVLKEIVTRLGTALIPHAVTASTGRAAVELDLGATTLHSLMCVGRDDLFNRPPRSAAERRKRQKNIDLAVSALHKNPGKLERIRSIQVLIIEEVSMISNTLLDVVDEIVSRARNRRKGSFGELQMVFVGDFAQLPPVKGEYCFESVVWRRMQPEVHTLHIQYRQSLDSIYAELLNRARFGALTKEDMVLLKTRLATTSEIDALGDAAVHLYSRNAEAQQHNTRCFSHLPIDAETRRFPIIVDVEPTGVLNPDAHDRTLALRAAETWLNENQIVRQRIVRLGARVMLTANMNVPIGLANGAVGTVVGFEMIPGEGSLPKVHFDRCGTHVVMRYQRKFDLNKNFGGFYEEMPLIFAWAMTIHRAQGITIQGTLVTALENSRDIFTPQQGYVALSRVKSLDALYLIRISQSAIYVSEKVRVFYNAQR